MHLLPCIKFEGQGLQKSEFTNISNWRRFKNLSFLSWWELTNQEMPFIWWNVKQVLEDCVKTVLAWFFSTLSLKYLNYYNPLNGLKNIILFVCIFISRRTWNKFGGQWWSVHLHCWGLDRFKNFHFLNFQKFLVIESCFSQWSQPAATRRWRSWSGWQKMDGRVQNAPLTSNSPLRKRWAGCTSIWSYGITLIGHTLSSNAIFTGNYVTSTLK